MRIVHSHCPRVTSPCPQIPTFARGQKSVYCDLCQTRVHNLSALTAREGADLLAGGGPLCARYARLLPAAALLLASDAALAQDAAGHRSRRRPITASKCRWSRPPATDRTP